MFHSTRSKISGLFSNILTADDKYCPHYKENIAQPIQTQFKTKIFFLNLLLRFWHLHKILNIFKKKIRLD